MQPLHFDLPPLPEGAKDIARPGVDQLLGLMHLEGLTRAETEALARYVGRYEALRFDPPSPDLVAAQEVVALGRIARPTLAFADPRQVTVAPSAKFPKSGSEADAPLVKKTPPTGNTPISNLPGPAAS